MAGQKGSGGSASLVTVPIGEAQLAACSLRARWIIWLSEMPYLQRSVPRETLPAVLLTGVGGRRLAIHQCPDAP